MRRMRLPLIGSISRQQHVEGVRDRDILVRKRGDPRTQMVDRDRKDQLGAHHDTEARYFKDGIEPAGCRQACRRKQWNDDPRFQMAQHVCLAIEQITPAPCARMDVESRHQNWRYSAWGMTFCR